MFSGQGQIPMIIAANKNDVKDKRAFGKDDVANVAAELGCDFKFTSAKTNENVEATFTDLVRKIRDYKIMHEKQSGKKGKKKKDKKCSLQ